ncbi:MAG: hypothetical protein QNJ85_10870 [Gammaproteobacteria bacterium]|nr:hypothetical protein [Gammaproteobacteria bacterium]
MMRGIRQWRPGLLLAGLILATPLGAHDGYIAVYSNSGDQLVRQQAPDHCLRDGVLVCHRFHPLFQPSSMRYALAPRRQADTSD